MKVPRLEAELKLQLLAYATATATATQDLSHVCNLHHSSGIVNPLIVNPEIEPASSWFLVGFVNH